MGLLLGFDNIQALPSAEDSGKAQGSREAMGSCRGGSSVWPLLPSPREVADALRPESSAKKLNGLDDEGKVLASSREHHSLVNASHSSCCTPLCSDGISDMSSSGQSSTHEARGAYSVSQPCSFTADMRSSPFSSNSHAKH